MDHPGIAIRASISFPVNCLFIFLLLLLLLLAHFSISHIVQQYPASEIYNIINLSSELTCKYELLTVACKEKEIVFTLKAWNSTRGKKYRFEHWMLLFCKVTTFKRLIKVVNVVFYYPESNIAWMLMILYEALLCWYFEKTLINWYWQFYWMNRLLQILGFSCH